MEIDPKIVQKLFPLNKYTKLEAYIWLQMNEYKNINQLSKIWGWSRGKTTKFTEQYDRKMTKKEHKKSNQNKCITNTREIIEQKKNKKTTKKEQSGRYEGILSILNM